MHFERKVSSMGFALLFVIYNSNDDVNGREEGGKERRKEGRKRGDELMSISKSRTKNNRRQTG